MVVSLRARIFIILTLLVLTTLSGAALTLAWLTRIGGTLKTVVDIHVAAFNTAQELQGSLAMQKGLLTYYFLDGDSQWLEQLGQAQKTFEEWLGRARKTAYTQSQREILNDVESRFIRYAYTRDQVIALYRSGDREAGFNLHKSIRGQFSAIGDLCERYKKEHEAGMAGAEGEIDAQVRSINILALGAIPGALLLGGLLFYVLMAQVLEPIRRLAVEPGAEGKRRRIPNEVKALSHRVSSLMEDVDQTQTQLQQSREHLLQSEKLAMVGKLAAGVAHTIRNPLTSVKMRLFSMERSLALSPAQREDFEVISEEIRHIDTIVRNFLEFSRPPKLKIQPVSLSDVVDSAIQLLRHRIESYGVEVELIRQRRLPPIQGDPEQLKEVFVNLMINACEAMTEGGRIVLREEEGVADPLGHVVVVRVRDNGPGIPEGLLERIFDPFFSSKEEGTGLGLSIAARIIEDHHGWINVRSREGRGTTFIITVPYVRAEGERAWLRS